MDLCWDLLSALICVGPGGNFAWSCLSVCGNLPGWGVVMGGLFVFGSGLHPALFHVDDLLALFHIRIRIVFTSSLCLTLSWLEMVTLGSLSPAHGILITPSPCAGWLNHRFSGLEESVSTCLSIKATQLGISSFPWPSQQAPSPKSRRPSKTDPMSHRSRSIPPTRPDHHPQRRPNPPHHQSRRCFFQGARSRLAPCS